MPRQRTLELSDKQRQDLLHYRDHDPRPYVRERCAALLKIADGQSARAVARHALQVVLVFLDEIDILSPVRPSIAQTHGAKSRGARSEERC